jgi:5-methyltetrahydrofolate--homocysteine methyltransferase
VAGRWDDVVEIARAATREGAHLVDVCVDYVGRDGVADMREVVGRLGTASTLPVMLDSTEPPVIEAGLDLLGGRCVVNSVNFEDGEGPGSRFARVMPLVREHGAAVVALCIDENGQARTCEEKVAVAERLIATLTGTWGMRESDILVDCLTFTLATGQEESRGDGAATIAAIGELRRRHPAVQTILGLSNVSFGLSPAARVVLNSVFLAECAAAGLTAAIVHASRIVPIARIPDEQREVALDLIYDRRREGYDPLTRLLSLFDGVAATSVEDRAAHLAALPLDERLARRIVDAERTGLEADLDAALAERPALDIVNGTLLAGMKTVGELFGSGQMQLPFVLASAEVMKAAVAYLEPHMDRVSGGGSKGSIVLATVKGDVHDIGKNLVDIILTNNGYRVVNLGIKQPIGAILEAADAEHADAVGMSGLLVKSTLVMRENLEEMTARGMRVPVLLGGAALTRAFVEEDLRALYDGEVHYARDAFEGLRLMDAVTAAARGEAPPPDPRAGKVRRKRVPRTEPEGEPELVGRSDVATDVDVPQPPFLGDRVVRGIGLGEVAALLDERATFLGQWGLRPSRGADGPGYEELVETEGRPRLRMWLERIAAERIVTPAVVYGYFPCVSKGDDLIVYHGDGSDRRERARFTFPRQRRDRRLCLADFFRPEESGELDVVAFHLVTMGARASEATAELFARDAYREYLELHGLCVQLTEALAEYWHARVRDELGIAGSDPTDLAGVLEAGYRGCRYSFGYPACPDLEDQLKVRELLRPERIGVSVSEEFQLVPEQSTSALIVHHPEASYFNAR